MNGLGGRVAAVVVALAIVVAGAAMVLTAGDNDRDHRRGVLARVPTSTSSTTTRPPTTVRRPAPRPVSPPVRVKVADLGIDAEVIRLGLHPDGTLEVPDDFAKAGWWSGGPAPGAVGPAVIVGHVDNKSGPAVFFKLRDLERGARIEVGREDGSTAVFAVTDVERYPKAEFPTKDVYGPTAGPALRLITCGGAFDRSSGHYLDNVVAYAEEVRS